MNESMYKILIVDDEEDIVEFVSYNLKREGFNVNIAQEWKGSYQNGRFFPSASYSPGYHDA